MLHAAISCAKSSYPGGLGCGQLLIDTSNSSDLSADLPSIVAKALAEHGWSQRDGEHFCPVHDPSQAGDVVEVAAARYQPLGDSGWEARIPPGVRPNDPESVSIEIRPAPDPAVREEPAVAPAPEPVSATDEAGAALEAFLAARAADLEATGVPRIGPGVLASWPRTGDDADGDYELTEDDLRALLTERSAIRALAPDSREHEDPFYRPGAVYVSENGWFRFTCKAVAAGIALGMEERLKDGPGMGPARRNVWRSVRTAGCDHEVDPETGEPLEPASDEEE